MIRDLTDGDVEKFLGAEEKQNTQRKTHSDVALVNRRTEDLRIYHHQNWTLTYQ